MMRRYFWRGLASCAPGGGRAPPTPTPPPPHPALWADASYDRAAEKQTCTLRGLDTVSCAAEFAHLLLRSLAPPAHRARALAHGQSRWHAPRAGPAAALTRAPARPSGARCGPRQRTRICDAAVRHVAASLGRAQAGRPHRRRKLAARWPYCRAHHSLRARASFGLIDWAIYVQQAAQAHP